MIGGIRVTDHSAGALFPGSHHNGAFTAGGRRNRSDCDRFERTAFRTGEQTVQQPQFEGHQQAGERPCGPCYAAKQAYDKRRRAAPAERQRARLAAQAQQKAYGELARTHATEYRALYEGWKKRLFDAAEKETA